MEHGRRQRASANEPRRAGDRPRRLARRLADPRRRRALLVRVDVGRARRSSRASLPLLRPEGRWERGRARRGLLAGRPARRHPHAERRRPLVGARRRAPPAAGRLRPRARPRLRPPRRSAAPHLRRRDHPLARCRERSRAPAPRRCSRAQAAALAGRAHDRRHRHQPHRPARRRDRGCRGRARRCRDQRDQHQCGGLLAGRPEPGDGARGWQGPGLGFRHADAEALPRGPRHANHRARDLGRSPDARGRGSGPRDPAVEPGGRPGSARWRAGRRRERARLLCRLGGVGGGGRRRPRALASQRPGCDHAAVRQLRAGRVPAALRAPARRGTGPLPSRRPQERLGDPGNTAASAARRIRRLTAARAAGCRQPRIARDLRPVRRLPPLRAVAAKRGARGLLAGRSRAGHAAGRGGAARGSRARAARRGDRGPDRHLRAQPRRPLPGNLPLRGRELLPLQRRAVAVVERPEVASSGPGLAGERARLRRVTRRALRGAHTAGSRRDRAATGGPRGQELGPALRGGSRRPPRPGQVAGVRARRAHARLGRRGHHGPALGRGQGGSPSSPGRDRRSRAEAVAAAAFTGVRRRREGCRRGPPALARGRGRTAGAGAGRRGAAPALDPPLPRDTAARGGGRLHGAVLVPPGPHRTRRALPGLRLLRARDSRRPGRREGLRLPRLPAPGRTHLGRAHAVARPRRAGTLVPRRRGASPLRRQHHDLRRREVRARPHEPRAVRPSRRARDRARQRRRLSRARSTSS